MTSAIRTRESVFAQAPPMRGEPASYASWDLTFRAISAGDHMIADIKKSAEEKMKKTIETLKSDLGKVRTGRAHTGVLDHVMVDYYGTPTPINGIANVTLLDARTIGVTPWEKKMTSAVEKAIRDSDLGLNPATVGETVRVPMPSLTEERRRDLIKVVHKEAETARVAVRNI